MNETKMLKELKDIFSGIIGLGILYIFIQIISAITLDCYCIYSNSWGIGQICFSFSILFIIYIYIIFKLWEIITALEVEINREKKRTKRKKIIKKIENNEINFCPYCGEKLPTNATFCPKCGKKII